MSKWIALILMIIDHLAILFINILPEGLYIAMRSFGRLSFPIFTYYVVLGLSRTSNIKKYITRLLSFGILSELIIRIFPSLPNNSLNIMLSFFVYGLSYSIFFNKIDINKYIKFTIFLLLIPVISLIDYSYYGFATFLVVVYITEHVKAENWVKRCIATVFIFLLSIFFIKLGNIYYLQAIASLAGMLLFNSNLESRVFSKSVEKWTFYIIYPLQWLIYYIIMTLIWYFNWN